MVKGKSARGEIVDFDLLKIKEQIASAPKTTNVVAREDFIDQKFKRRLRKMTDNVSVTTAQVSAEDSEAAPQETVEIERPVGYDFMLTPAAAPIEELAELQDEDADGNEPPVSSKIRLTAPPGVNQ